MFLGYDACLGYEPFLYSCYTDYTTDSIKISNMSIDAIDVRDTLDITESITKPEWDTNTVMYAEFENNMEAGTLSNNGLPVQKIRFKRCRTDSLDWMTMATLDYDEDITNYSLVDYFVENGTTYSYKLVAVTQSTEGKSTTKSVEANYFGVFITGRNTSGSLVNFPLVYDTTIDDTVLNQDKTIQTTISSKYPAILYGTSAYRTGSFSGRLVSDTTMTNGYPDMSAEIAYKESIEDIIYANKSVLIRYYNTFVLATITGYKTTPIDNSGAFGLSTYNIEWCEIEDGTDLNVLSDNDLDYDISTS